MRRREYENLLALRQRRLLDTHGATRRLLIAFGIVAAMALAYWLVFILFSPS